MERILRDLLNISVLVSFRLWARVLERKRWRQIPSLKTAESDGG